MKYLLDVAPLIALMSIQHVHHARANAWVPGKKLFLCPITELAFIRIVTSKVFNIPMAESRKALADFIADSSPEWIPADIRALSGEVARTSATTTDFYLANLAHHHGLKLATFDTSISHPAVELIP